MGGWEGINKMDPVAAINQYTNLRKSLWPGNDLTDSAHRLGREREWALKHAKPAAEKTIEAKKSDSDNGTATPTIHYSPNVVIHAAGHDAATLKQTILDTMSEHSRHLVRTLQDYYRSEVQRVNYA
jgi:hypothetical protein